MNGHSKQWTERFSASLPNKESLTAHPWLRPVANRLFDPKLWRLQHESVARGVAVGLFWAFVLPIAQIVAAAAHCTWWRANIPVAAAMTMITNPLTIGFWLYLAYQAGALVLGAPVQQMTPNGIESPTWFAEFGWPTLLGMGMFAVGGATLGYTIAKLFWRLRIWQRRRARLSVR